MLSKKIIGWYQKNKRDLPWRKTQDPYKVWLSEIILQQTRVEQGLPYYNEFVKKFKTVNDLATASEDEVLRTWQGLGYYSRARNLHFTAQHVSNNLNGVFPSTYKELIKLKGIGAYTAAAISSISFGENRAVVDGNVYRVLSRIYEIDTPINSSKGIKEFATIAQDLISPENPADYNQGVMELGARVCLPRNPKCSICPIIDHCGAYKNKSHDKYPVKLKKQKSRNRYFNYLVINHNNSLYLNKREGSDVWNGLFEFFLIETISATEDMEILEENFPSWLNDIKKIGNPTSSKQVLSHQNIYAKFWPIEINTLEKTISESFYSSYNIEQLPKHRLIEKYLLDNNI
ncbi:A/G-specific adenine glycosylase [Arcticibacterium luteifluviistationis]|uniref:Adenine DNA glycosylase n=1 Tax=Arcticibacterium luteifluviistationis TaxID=1784714 RepID=A0A2Z4GAM9_9BACT|nr:A/G-specific adenine glycosylase [Arcticibacterium luteifluviistationis]AWV98128.1 A/G-specific adenine glycosylase [Arcticibacterium luteifluviistationis]